MNKSLFKVILLASAIFILIALNGFKELKSNVSVELQVKEDFLHGIDSFYHSVDLIELYCNQNSTATIESETLQKLFLQSRTYYKEIEYLAEYLDPEFSENFNGADLVKGDPNILSTNEINPKGLQVLETLIYGEISDVETKRIINLCKQLKSDIIQFKNQIETTTISSTIILDACRKEIMRICFLGITGFDSPSAKNSIPECAVALDALYQSLNLYLTRCKDEAIVNQIQKTFEDAIIYFYSNTDFEHFDRLEFIKHYGNRLYGLILDLHLSLEIPLPSALSNQTLSVNYLSRNLFDENLLNPYYYSPARQDKKESHKVELGQLLFFDPILSSNNKRSCASCHKPNLAFTDGNTKSLALDFNGTVSRNAPTLINAVFQGDYFYDLRTEFIETQIDHVIFNKDEFNSNYELIIQKMKQSPEYIQLFKQSFPDQPGDAINGYTITKAIADYVRSLVAMNSEFDQYMCNEKITLSIEIKNGFNLFMGKAKCGTCHFAPTFYGTIPPVFIESETEVIGVPLYNDTLHSIIDNDFGRFNIQQSPVYKYAFKTQTIRNIKLTAPYMHNGVFNTLEEVLKFYNDGGGAGIQIYLDNQTLDSEKLNLTQSEINNIITFMHALTDTSEISSIPKKLPQIINNSALSNRKIGGEY